MIITLLLYTKNVINSQKTGAVLMIYGKSSFKTILFFYELLTYQHIYFIMLRYRNILV